MRASSLSSLLFPSFKWILLITMVSVVTMVMWVTRDTWVEDASSKVTVLKGPFLGSPVPLPPASLPQPPQGAYIGENLSDFVYDDAEVFPRGAAREIQNVTKIGPRTFNFVLRLRGNPWSKINPKGTHGAWYDGDRGLEWNEGKHPGAIGIYIDKTRAEFMGFTKLGKYPFSEGETWMMGTTVRLDPNFVPSSNHCTLMQPIDQGSRFAAKSINGDDVTWGVYAYPVHAKASEKHTIREFVIRRGVWTSIRIIIHLAKAKNGKNGNGSYGVSINGDAYQTVSNIDTTQASDIQNGKFGGTWGLYGTATTDVNGNPMKDMIVQHSNIFLKRLR